MKLAMDFYPKCYLFRECISYRIGQNIQNEVSLQKDLSLKKLLYINLYPVSRDPSIFLYKSGRLRECSVKRQNRNNTQASNKSSFKMQKLSLEFQETAFLYSPLESF